MKFLWKVIDVNQDTGSLLVNYYEPDLYKEGITYNIDLPIVNGELPQKEEVAKMISNMVPTYELERRVNLILNKPKIAHLLEMVDTTGVVNEIPFVVTATEVETDLSKTVTPTTVF